VGGAGAGALQPGYANYLTGYGSFRAAMGVNGGHAAGEHQ
jgi:hypothetical protein